MANIVLIASADHLAGITERVEFDGAMAFSDADALQALEIITRFRPPIVALDRVFAGTSRGTALINRIKADPALNLCEIRIVPNDTPRHEQIGSASDGASGIDTGGTRRAPRYDNIDVEVLIDGGSARLVDLSMTGAQVLSPSILRPNQRIRLVLPDAARPIRLAALVVWASFEMPDGGTAQYRAGIDFFDADPDTVAGFYAANKKTPESASEPS